MSDYLEDMKTLAAAMDAGDTNVLRDLHRKALLELEVYKTLPCNGRLYLPSPKEEPDRRNVSSCDMSFESSCHMRDHRGCPKRLREALGGRYAMSHGDIAAELRRALVPGAIARLIGYREEQPSKAIDAANAWMDSKKRVLVLSGGPRAGKTVAACWAIRQMAKSALFFNPSLLFQYGADRGYQERALTCGLLVIDDIGTENADEGGKFASRLDVLVCTRFDAGDRTVLTTNLPAGEFAKRYGQRVTARIQAGGSFAAVGASQFVADREPGEEG